MWSTQHWYDWIVSDSSSNITHSIKEINFPWKCYFAINFLFNMASPQSTVLYRYKENVVSYACNKCRGRGAVFMSRRHFVSITWSIRHWYDWTVSDSCIVFVWLLYTCPLGLFCFTKCKPRPIYEYKIIHSYSIHIIPFSYCLTKTI